MNISMVRGKHEKHERKYTMPFCGWGKKYKKDLKKKNGWLISSLIFF